MNKLSFLVVCALVAVVADCKKVHYIHWNRNNPMFRIDNTDHIVDVNQGNLPWEYDQVNLICPVSKPGDPNPESHVIYSVSKEEYESCRITNPKPKIVAVCNRPHRLMYFTITFRSFTPTPGGLEFHPGHDYYFISTSTGKDLHRRVGGGCATHNMRMIFKVHDNTLNDQEENDLEPKVEIVPSTSTAATPTSSEHEPRDEKSKRGEYIYYYHPRDLIELENTVSNKKISRDYENEVWRKEALRFTSPNLSSSSSSSCYTLSSLLLTLVTAMTAQKWLS